MWICHFEEKYRAHIDIPCLRKTDRSKVWICAQESLKNAVGYIKQVKFIVAVK